MRRTVTIMRPGPLALIQDLGRPGFGSMGVSPSGAADQSAFRLGNRLLGQPEGTCAIEFTFGGLEVRFDAPTELVLSGAECPAMVDSSVPWHAPVWVRAGDLLRIGPPFHSLRSYLCVRGGFDVAPVLGSTATDVLSGLGPDPLRPGQVLSLSSPAAGFPNVDVAPVRVRDQPLRVLPGPRRDWFADPDLLVREAWVVTTESNRVGVRLQGAALSRNRAARDRELPSEGMVRGAVQVPPSGQPIVVLNDHPVTGGYPVIAVLTSDSGDLLAQQPAGSQIRFRWR